MNASYLLSTELGRVFGHEVVLLPLKSNKRYEQTGLQFIINEIKDPQGLYARVEYTANILTHMQWKPHDDFTHARIIFFENNSFNDFLSLNANMLEASPERAMQTIDGDMFYELLQRKAQGTLINEYFLIARRKLSPI